MSARQILALARCDWDPSSEQTIEQYVCEWANCRHAEVNQGGDVFIETPQRGHYLDDERMGALVAWLAERGIVEVTL